MALRELIIRTAEQIQGLEVIEETLKWGEPSYLAKQGSTIRMDWKPRNPDHYALYFKCTSLLVESFKKRFPTTFQYEGNRAILLSLDENLPVDEIGLCIETALLYHKVKHLPLLGL